MKHRGSRCVDHRSADEHLREGTNPSRDETVRMVGYYRGRHPTADEAIGGTEVPDVLTGPGEQQG